MSNINKVIKDFYCNGFGGRRYDLADSVVEAEGDDWIVLRTKKGKPVYIEFDGWPKQEHINRWVGEPDLC